MTGDTRTSSGRRNLAAICSENRQMFYGGECLLECSGNCARESIGGEFKSCKGECRESCCPTRRQPTFWSTSPPRPALQQAHDDNVHIVNERTPPSRGDQRSSSTCPVLCRRLTYPCVLLRRQRR